MSNSKLQCVGDLMMERAIPFIGISFNRLTILRILGGNRRRGAVTQCRCACGELKVLNLAEVRSGEVQSCGCLLREVLALPTHARIRNGRKRTPEYKSKRTSQERWKAKNKSKVAATAKRFREHHSEQVKADKAAYYQTAKPKIYAKLKRRFATDLGFKIEATLRSRIRKVLKRQNAVRSGKLPTLLGCSLDEFKAYILSKFTEGMTWDKFLAGEIHIDHDRPCRAFDLTKPEEQAKCFHFSNHVPMWAPDNLKKSDKLPDGTRARLINYRRLPVPV